MHGEVGKAITNEINNVHNPVIVGLKNSLEFLGSEFSKTITDFQNLVGETSATAVLAEETLDDAIKKLNEADEKHKVMDTNFKSIYDGISTLYRLSAPLSNTFYTNTQTARKYVQDTKNKVNAFDKMTTTSSTEQLFSALGSQMVAAARVKSLSYSDPVLTNFVAHEDLGKAIYEMDQQYGISAKDLDSYYDEVVNQKVLKDWCSIYDSKYSPSNYGDIKIEPQRENW